LNYTSTNNTQETYILGGTTIPCRYIVFHVSQKYIVARCEALVQYIIVFCPALY
jgi:hypothetical protein